MALQQKTKQSGLSLVGLIFVLVIIGLMAVVAMKVFPTVAEYMSIKKAIAVAKASGTSVATIKTAFDKQAEVGYIESISSKDLEISKNGDDIEVSFAYQKKIPLFGPASLLLEYEGTTAKTQLVNKKKVAEQ